MFHDFVASVPTTPSAEVSSITNGGERAEEGFVLSGIDVKAGGTWLGINKLGGVAFMYVQSRVLNISHFYMGNRNRPYVQTNALLPVLSTF